MFIPRRQPIFVQEGVVNDPDIVEENSDYELLEKPDNAVVWILRIAFVIGILGTFILPWLTGSKGWLYPEFTILIYVPLFIYLISKWYVKNAIKGFELVERLHKDTFVEGDVCLVYLKIKYKSWLPFPMTFIEDRFPPNRSMASPVTLLKKSMLVKGFFRLKYKQTFNRGFGNFVIGPLKVTVCDPLRFFKESKELDLKTTLSVWLNPPSQEDMDLINETEFASAGSSNSNKAGNGMDFYGIKEYAPGDDVKAMCWTKSASIGKPVIKQFERETMPKALIAIHTDRTQVRGLGFGNNYRRCFRIAAAVIFDTQQKGVPVSLAFVDGENAAYSDVSSSVPAYGFMTDMYLNLKPGEPETGKALIDIICQKTSPGDIVFMLSHTLALDYDTVFKGIQSLYFRGVKVILWVFDDSKMINFSEWGKKIKPQEFMDKVTEMGIDFRILSPNEEYEREEEVRLAREKESELDDYTF